MLLRCSGKRTIMPHMRSDIRNKRKRKNTGARGAAQGENNHDNNNNDSTVSAHYNLSQLTTERQILVMLAILIVAQAGSLLLG